MFRCSSTTFERVPVILDPATAGKDGTVSRSSVPLAAT
jgi:hypothetical protein